MAITAKIDEYGKAAWIALIVFGFVAYWPLGLAILVYTIWSGRMGCWKTRGFGRQQMQAMGSPGTWWQPQRASSGNRAFDEYREETLKRLEEEQREFKEFLDRLRFAKDKTEFDEFMAERRRRPEGSVPETQPQN
jgi:hypothetical protein